MVETPQNALAVVPYITIKWMFHYFHLIKLKKIVKQFVHSSEGSLIFSIF